MINYANTLFVKTSEGDYVPGEPITDEGMALVFKKHDGKTKLGLSTGADDSTSGDGSTGSLSFSFEIAGDGSRIDSESPEDAP